MYQTPVVGVKVVGQHTPDNLTTSSLDSDGTTNPLPAGAVTIPADARGAFHLPFAASNCGNTC